MTVLEDKSIVEEYVEGDLNISPFNVSQVEPSSYDMRLGDKIAIFESGKEDVIIPNDDNGDKLKYIDISDGAFIEPDVFALATTQEWVDIPDYLSGRVYGRSSFGRIGIEVHRAGWIDAGFRGTVTLEIENELPSKVYLESGMKICQIVFEDVRGSSKNPYNGDYQYQKGVTESKLL